MDNSFVKLNLLYQDLKTITSVTARMLRRRKKGFKEGEEEGGEEGRGDQISATNTLQKNN